MVPTTPSAGASCSPTARSRSSSTATRRRMRASRALRMTWDNVDVVHNGETVSIHGNGFSGIARLTFLNLLQRRARALGVDVRFHTAVADPAAPPRLRPAPGRGRRQQPRAPDMERLLSALRRRPAEPLHLARDGAALPRARHDLPRGAGGPLHRPRLQVQPHHEHVHRRVRPRGVDARGLSRACPRPTPATTSRRCSRTTWAADRCSPIASSGGSTSRSSATGGGTTGTSPSPATPPTPRTSPSARAPSWRWRIAVAAGHLVADRQLALHRHVDLDELDHTGRQSFATAEILLPSSPRTGS